MFSSSPPPFQTSGSGPTYLQNLNPEQYAAVTIANSHALVLAGAGSGKTRVLTTRIAWLLQTGQASPSGILAVTFTNKAAKEMLVRLSALLPVNLRGMWIGTFHGICNRFLRTHYQAANLPQSFQILDTQDQLSAVKRLCKQFNVDDERFPAKQLSWYFSACKEEGLRAKDVVAKDPDTRKKVELYALYEDQCQREGVVDFGELMLSSYEILQANAPLREHYQKRFQFLLIDEFQDTNKLQYAWIKLLAGKGDVTNASPNPPKGGAVMAVGDDDQSIYAFRGARVGNMSDFLRDFKVEQQIKLEENYRSFSNILESANTLISHNNNRLGKNLRTSQGAGEPVRVLEMPSDFDDARWMVEEIKALINPSQKNNHPVYKKQEIAVLYRSNAQSRVLETALFNASVPYKVYGGLRFFERAEIKHALAYLRLIENVRDNTSFLRVVNFPPRGIGARTLEVLQDNANAAGCALADAVSTVPGKAGINLSSFLAKIEVLREATAGATLKEIVTLVLQHSGLIEHYRTEKEGADRIENLEELLNAAESFVSLEGFGRDAVAMPETKSVVSNNLNSSDLATASDALPNNMFDEPTGETISPLAAFLSHAALEAGDNQAQAGQDAVQLMTVHAAKGLEFDVVFITGLEEGLFPHENSMSDVGGLEEERRLMYVAITRARQRLYLSYCQTRMLHGQTRYNMKSRFLEELPEHALKWITPTQANKMAYGSAYPASNGFANRNFGNANSGTHNNTNRWANSSASNFQAAQAPSVVPSSMTRNVVVQNEQAQSFSLKVGMEVFHNKFGEGKILTLEGSGADGRAHINFKRHGAKWLALSVAKLTPI